MSLYPTTTSLRSHALTTLAASLLACATGCGDSGPTYLVQPDAGTADGGDPGNAVGSGGSAADPEGGADGRGETGGSSGTGAVGTGGTAGAGGTAGEEAGGIGAPCAADTECASGVCVPETDDIGPTGWTDGYCIKGCANHAQCLPDGACVEVGENVNACLATCTSDATCRTGYICEVSGAYSFCVPNCKVPGAGCIEGALCRENGRCEIDPGEDLFTGPYLDLETGYGYSCGIRSDGTLTCFAHNNEYFYYGEELGKPPEGAFVQLSIGYESACAISVAGELVCWGGPLASTAPPGTFEQVSLSDTFDEACAIRSDASLVCWDWTGVVVEGDDAPPAGQFVQVSVGDGACAVRSDGTVACWGGYIIADRAWLTEAPAHTFDQLALNSLFDCALKFDGTLWCGGTPLHVYFEGNDAVDPGKTYVQLDVGSEFACAITESSSVECWGIDDQADLVQFDRLTGTYQKVVVGVYNYGCVLGANGSVACWGDWTDCTTSGATGCGGAIHPISCDPLGVWTFLDTCENSACDDGVCIGECVPDHLRCTGDDLEECNRLGSWEALETCAKGCMSSEPGGVRCRECVGGEIRCDLITQQACNDAQGAFEDVSTCESACVAGACIQGECNYGESRCQGVGLEVCSSQGTWVAVDCPRGCAQGSCIFPAECRELESCCFDLSGIDQITCENVAERGTASACESTRDAYRNLGLCD